MKKNKSQDISELKIRGKTEGSAINHMVKNAIKSKEEEIKQKAIEAYIDNCEYKSDWCCGCAEAHGAILSEPDVCMGRDCPMVKQFIKKLTYIITYEYTRSV